VERDPFLAALDAGLDRHRFTKPVRFFLAPPSSNSLRGVLPRFDLGEYPPWLIDNECAAGGVDDVLCTGSLILNTEQLDPGERSREAILQRATVIQRYSDQDLLRPLNRRFVLCGL
jgi:hypothetical protein